MKLIYLSIFIFTIFIFSNQRTVSNVNSNSNASDSTEVCIVSGEKIEGEGVKYTYLNTDVKFCCEGCEKSFKKNPAKFLSAAGLRCPVCNEDDAKAEISGVTDGVKYYFCADGCKTSFESDPESYLKNYRK